MVSAMKKTGVSSILIAVVLLAVAVIAEAQQPARMARVGWLATRSSASGTGLDRLRRHLRALGYIEGKNIAFEFRSADDKLDRLPPWLMSWSVSKLTYSSRLRRLKPWPPGTLPERSPLLV